jgi:phenylpropionate dioxygenase-like ring-hydroxylating dioxygenase large terminal subunit
MFEAETRKSQRVNLPQLSRSWYYLCSAAEVGSEPISVCFADKPLVVFRTAAGRPAATLASCPHMGADLSRGTVVGECLRCPFHGWEFDAVSGACTRVPSENQIPPHARVPVYPVVERHGLLFIFWGSEPTYPLPFFANCDEGDFVAARPIRLQVECPWYMVSANGFDVSHLEIVHHRMPVEPPQILYPDPHACHITHHYRIGGETLGDRLLRQVSGDTTRLHFTSWHGSLLFGITDSRLAPVYILSAVRPAGEEACVVDIIVYTRMQGPGSHPVLRLAPLRWLQRSLVGRFFSHETNSLRHVRYRPDSLVESDRVLADYLSWLTGKVV